MRIGIFSMAVISLLLLFSYLNCRWIGKILGAGKRTAFRIVYALLTLLAGATYIGMRFLGPFEGDTLIGVIFYFGSFWTVLQLLLLLAWPVSRLIVLVQKWRFGSKPLVNGRYQPAMTRRTFLFNAALAPPVAMTGINALGILDAEGGAVLRRMDLAYNDLPAHLQGLRIGHMTDVHIGPYVSVSDVKKMAALLQQEPPDILAITGDFVDDLQLLPAAMAVLAPLMKSIPLGTWFCMGNHEHLRGSGPIRQILLNSGVKILDNQHQSMPYRGGTFALAGVDYPINTAGTTRLKVAETYLDEACAKIHPEAFTVMLAHHPDFLPGAFARNIGLTLAGHTHGAQVGWGNRSAMQFLYPYMRGVYGAGNSLGYVSSGAGHWLPFRLNCPPEVSIITLKKKA